MTSSAGATPKREPANLFEVFWRKARSWAFNLITTREGQGLPHGLAVLVLRRRLPARTKEIPIPRADRIALTSPDRIVLLGYPSDFRDTVVAGILQQAGYPAHFEIAEAPASPPSIRYRQGTAPPGSDGNSRPNLSQEHLGLLFFGVTQDVRNAHVLLATGASALGIHAAAVWASQRALANIPVPPDWPASPIEAVVRVIDPGKVFDGDLTPADLETMWLLCGWNAYDPRTQMWRPIPCATEVRVIVNEAGVPLEIYVNGVKNGAKPTGDLFRMLYLLARVSRKENETWISAEYVLKALDGEASASRLPTVHSRISDIRGLSSAPDFIDERKDTDPFKRSYRMNASIIFETRGQSATTPNPDAATGV